jgi:hypothetical protein
MYRVISTVISAVFVLFFATSAFAEDCVSCHEKETQRSKLERLCRYITRGPIHAWADRHQAPVGR